MKKEKLKIGIDIDDTVADFINSYLDFYKFRFGKEFNVEDIEDIYLREPFGHTCEDVIEILGEFHKTNYFKKMKLIEGVEEILNKLFFLHKIFFITSRRVSNEEITKEFLKKYFLNKPYEVYFSGDIYSGRKTKDEICSEIGVDVLIEDNKFFSYNCAEKGIKVFLLDKPWNQNCEHENITRVKNWNEIIDKLK
ncbi:MAG: hypothetical protein PVJ67_03205 [Candidatus Pacearchaeota archaeon]|jgi:uncharacterized HAD superfamily protein